METMDGEEWVHHPMTERRMVDFWWECGEVRLLPAVDRIWEVMDCDDGDCSMVPMVVVVVPVV